MGTKRKKKWREERAGCQGNALVVIHFEDAAFDHAHVSVPHSLMSEGQRTSNQWLNDAQSQLANRIHEICAKSVNEAIRVP